MRTAGRRRETTHVLHELAVRWAASALGLGIVGVGLATRADAQAFLEYPGHPATYGDHTITTTWTGGPTSVLLTFDSDESILHEDGIGQSQRTARNTLTHTPPSDPENPQDYDDLEVIGVYGARLPLLQQMSADGTSTLHFAFGELVATGFDFFVTDVDTADDLVLRAFGPGDVPIDMATWSLVAEGDLSLYKNTGTGYSDVVAPVPSVLIASEAIAITAVDATNYNRSYSIFRAPVGSPVARFELVFTGIQNSASRSEAGTGSHVYVGLATLPESAGLEGSTGPDAPGPGGAAETPAGHRSAPEFSLLSANPGSGPLRFSVQLERAGEVEIVLYDPAGRRVAAPVVRSLAAGRQEVRLVPPGALPTGVYLARLRSAQGEAALTWVYGR